MRQCLSLLLALSVSSIGFAQGPTPRMNNGGNAEIMANRQLDEIFNRRREIEEQSRVLKQAKEDWNRTAAVGGTVVAVSGLLLAYLGSRYGADVDTRGTGIFRRWSRARPGGTPGVAAAEAETAAAEAAAAETRSRVYSPGSQQAADDAAAAASRAGDEAATGAESVAGAEASATANQTVDDAAEGVENLGRQARSARVQEASHRLAEGVRNTGKSLIAAVPKGLDLAVTLDSIVLGTAVYMTSQDLSDIGYDIDRAQDRLEKAQRHLDVAEQVAAALAAGSSNRVPRR